MTLSSETESKLKRAKEVTQHLSLADLFDKALSALIEKQEKKIKLLIQNKVLDFIFVDCEELGLKFKNRPLRLRFLHERISKTRTRCPQE